MTEVSKNNMDLVKNTGASLKGKFGQAFVGTLVAFGPLVLLSLLVPYFIGIAISILLFGVMETGYIRFMREVVAGNRPKLSLIFSEIKTGWAETFIGTCTLLMFILGGILFVIPGVILYGYYAMSLFVAEKENINELKGALTATRHKMKNNIITMYSYKLFYWLFYIILFALAVLGYIGVFALAESNIVLAVLVGIVGVLVFLVVYSIITMYYHTSNELFFNEMLYYEEKHYNTKQKVNVVEEKPEVVEAPVVEEKAVEKPVKKTPAKKTTTTTTKKTTTKTKKQD